MPTKSLLDAPPRILHRPTDVHSLDAARDAIELANAYLGHDLLPAQELVLEAGMGQRADGSWAAPTVCHFGGRQGSGKTETAIARELAGLVLFGEELIIHTAHDFKTANESFLRTVAIFENYDDLRARTSRIRYGHGERGIEFLSGQRLMFLPRTGGAGRGFSSVDLLVLDEAQHAQPEHMAAAGPTLLANPNAQAWAMGSGGLSTSEVAWGWRRQALEGRGERFAYVEFTAEDVELVDGRVVATQPDPMDRNCWANAMPGYGVYVGDDQVLALYDLIGAEMFTREGLCVWDPEPNTAGGVIPPHLWAACADPLSGPQDPVTFALDVSEDREWSAIAVAGRSGRGGVHVELTADLASGLFDYRPGTDWLVERAKAIHKTWGRPFAVVKGSPAWSLQPELAAAGVKVLPVSREEFTQSCGTFYDAVRQGGVRHLSQSALDVAVANLARKSVSDAFVWDRRSAVTDISPAIAVTLAMWACSQPETTPTPGLVDLNDFVED